MRTLLFLLAGFLLVGTSFILGKLFLESCPEASTWATSLFIVVWLALAAANLMAGVARAGYTIAEELPILSADIRSSGALHASSSVEGLLIGVAVSCEET